VRRQFFPVAFREGWSHFERKQSVDTVSWEPEAVERPPRFSKSKFALREGAGPTGIPRSLPEDKTARGVAALALLRRAGRAPSRRLRIEHIPSFQYALFFRLAGVAERAWSFIAATTWNGVRARE
jgi:hypothetical protein